MVRRGRPASWDFLHEAAGRPVAFTEDPESYDHDSTSDFGAERVPLGDLGNRDGGSSRPSSRPTPPSLAEHQAVQRSARIARGAIGPRTSIRIAGGEPSSSRPPQNADEGVGERARWPKTPSAAHFHTFPSGSASGSRGAKRRSSSRKKSLPIEELMALQLLTTQIGNRSGPALTPTPENARLETGRATAEVDDVQPSLSAAVVRARRRGTLEQKRPNYSTWNRVQNAFCAAASRVVDTHVNFTQRAFPAPDAGKSPEQAPPPSIHARDTNLTAGGSPRQHGHKRQRSRILFGSEERTLSQHNLLAPENGQDASGATQERVSFTESGTRPESLQELPSIARTLGGKSFILFGPQNTFRTWCTKLLMHRWTEPFLFVVIVFQWIVYVMGDYGKGDSFYDGGFRTSENGKNDFGDNFSDWALLFVNVIYTIEALLRSVVFGLVINPRPDSLPRTGNQISEAAEPVRALGKARLWSVFRAARDLFKSKRSPHDRQPPHLAYLRHTFTRLDLCSVVAFWLDLYMMASTGRGSNVFKCIAALRLARLLLLTEGLATILHSLKMSAPLLLNVSVFIMFFFLLFGILGEQALRGSLSRRCVYLNETNPVNSQTVAPARTCGGYYADAARTIAMVEYQPALVTDAVLGAKGYVCDYGQHCISMPIPFDHLGTFDNIFVSLMTVFTVVTMENWSFLSYSVMDAENRWSALYFCVIILTMSFVMIQMFLAVITEMFSKVRDETKHSAFSEKEEVRILTEISEDGTWDIRDVSGNKLNEDEDGDDRPSTFLRRVKYFFFSPLSGRPGPSRGRQGEADEIRRSMWQIILRSRLVWAARHILVGIVTSEAFGWMSTIVVAASLLTQALQPSTADAKYRATLESCETAYTLYLAAEIMMRLATIPHLRPRHFLLEKWTDRVDLVLAIATCVMLMPFVKALSFYRYLTVFQVMRAYRLVKVVPSVNRLMSTVLGSFISLANVTLFMTMSFLIIGPVCTQLLGGDFARIPAPVEGLPDDDHLSFDDVPMSLLSLYYILIGDNWWDVLYNAIRSQAPYGYFNAVFAALVIVVTYCFMHYIILSLLVAVVLENFEIDEDQKQLMLLRKFLKAEQSYGRKTIESNALLKLNPYLYLKPKPRQVEVNTLPPDLVSNIRKTSFQQFMNQETSAEKTPGEQSASLPSVWRRITAHFDPYTERPRKYMQKISANREPTSVPRFRRRDQAAGTSAFGSTVPAWKVSTETVDVYQERDTVEADFIDAHPEYDRVLCFIWPNNPFRKLCQRVIGANADRDPNAINYFNLLVFAAVCSSVVLTVIDSPMERHARLLTTGTASASVMTTITMVILGIFTLEFVIKVVAEGFLFTPHAYLRDPYNCLDFVVLVTYYVYEMPAALSTGVFNPSRLLRATRSLRPLRLINYLKGVREIFRLTMLGLPRILDVAIFSVMLMIPFAIYGMNIFSGYYARCNDSGRNMSECVGDYLQRLNLESNITAIYAPRVFANPGYSFDSIGDSILTIFEMASTEGWSDAMFAGISVPGEIGGAAEYSRSSPQLYNVIYFTVMMFFCSVLIIQLFIGVIVANFVTRSGQALLTVDQRRWIDLQRQLKLVRPSRRPARPMNKFRAWCYDLAIHKRSWYYNFVTLAICANIVVMATEKQKPTWWEQGLSMPQPTSTDMRTQYEAVFDIRDIAYTVCIGIYVFDVFVKLVGLGWQKWRSSRWNIYDASVTAISAVAITIRGIIYSALVSEWSDPADAHALLSSSGWLFQVQKIALIGIGLRIVQRIDALQTLLRAILNALPSVANIGVVFLLVLVFYAIIFTEVFGLVRIGPNTGPHANVWYFGNSLFLMVRMTTGEAWNQVMDDFMVDAPNCVDNEGNYLLSDCGGRVWAFILFISFYVICTYIFLNMFIVVVIDNFNFAYQEDAAFALIKREDLRSFKKTWASFDPKATGYIQVADLHRFLSALRGRFDVRIYRDEFTVGNLKEAVKNAEDAARQQLRNSAESSRWHLERSRSVMYQSQASMAAEITMNSYKTINAKLAELDVDLICQRKRWLNFVCYDALSIAVEGKGIPFRDMLQVLSYMLVDIERSLKVEDLIKRQEKAGELEEKMAIEFVRGIFKTIHQRRAYLRMLKDTKCGDAGAEVPSIVIERNLFPGAGFLKTGMPGSPTMSHETSSLGTVGTVSSAGGHSEVSAYDDLAVPDLSGHSSHSASDDPFANNVWLGPLRQRMEDPCTDEE